MFSRRLLTAAALLSAGLLLSACTGDDSSSDDASDAQTRLDSAASALAKAEALDITLTTEALPDGQRGLLSATGVGTHAPAFQGDVEVVAGGATIGAEVIAVDGKVWAKTGFSPVFTVLDPASLGAPDPAALVGAGADDGLGGLLGATEDVATGDKSRDGSEVLTEITGTIPGETVAELIPTADTTADFDVTYRLTDDDVLHDAKVTGPFYGDEQVTYVLTLAPHDGAVTIAAP